ncbi:MAG: hypothetical protein K5695_10305 [Oscillospiraceae bacterium]|nr:hypothetical protein [Oscillospiraceae bacterium]
MNKKNTAKRTLTAILASLALMTAAVPAVQASAAERAYPLIDKLTI